MARRTVRIAMNGVTGRMGYNQHLVRSIVAMRAGGGVRLPDGTSIWPEPVLLGRDESKLKTIADAHDLDEWSTSLDEVLGDPSIEVYFDAQSTQLREGSLRKAIAAGKHIYTEKPIAQTVAASLELARAAQQRGLITGVVEDKLFLAGLIKLKRLVDGGFFGRILSVRVEFGYWVFEGDWQQSQRPSWNYRVEEGGGIVLDMFPHWRYVLEHVIAPVRSVYAHGVTHIPTRWDEAGKPFDATADDAVYAILELDGGVLAQVNSSWAVRVNRDELVEFQVDGTDGSAVAGLRRCKVQHRSMTPKPVWNPDLPAPEDFRAEWREVPDNETFANGFQTQWEQYLTYLVRGEQTPFDLLEGAKGVQLADLATQSCVEGRRMTVPDLVG